MNDLDDLASWLRATLDRVEEQARTATAGSWTDEDNGSIVHDGPSLSQSNENWGRYVVASVGAYDGGRPTTADAEHIVFWQPARVLRLVESTRQVLALMENTLSTASEYFTVESCDETDAILAEAVLRQIAAPFGDQPGYRQEWAGA